MVDDQLVDRLDRKMDKQREKFKRKTEEHAAFGGVMDSYTTININKLVAKGIIQEFVGIISAGKEANVYYGIGENDKPIAIKVYKIDPQNTKWMKNYIIGDPRFNKIGNSTHKIIYTWCRKEFKNLTQLKRHGINVPTPLINRDNVLVMEFIGDDNGSPAPRLKDVSEIENAPEHLNYIISQIKDMYLNAHLVHGDLSEYNILFYQNKQIIIDVSQAVSVYHINAPVYLKRDIINVTNYFKSILGERNVPDSEEIFNQIMESA